MAIGTTPLFSKISGSVGPVDYRTRRNGKIEIGKKRIPANPQSTEQQNTRNAYGRLHELWQNAAWIDKTQYNNMADALNISPWNAFLMHHLSVMRLNPVGYWPHVEGTGNTLHDFTTNENYGTIYGATWQQSGKYNTPYLYYDGLDDYVSFGNKSTFDIGTDNYSMCQWIKTTASDGWFLNKYIGWSHRLVGNKLNAFYYFLGALKINILSASDINDDLWHSIAATLNRNEKARLYIDSDVVASKDISPDVGENWTSIDKMTTGVRASGLSGYTEMCSNKTILFRKQLSLENVEKLNIKNI